MRWPWSRAGQAADLRDTYEVVALSAANRAELRLLVKQLHSLLVDEIRDTKQELGDRR